ncbi:LD-carboxypeptidase [Massilia sp. 2TAF26]|uniref:S66 peptidase family protein n=1 Tax=Massilia sp. 2TAF26 TaxID=3233012 RepID=UPI003F9EA3EF
MSSHSTISRRGFGKLAAASLLLPAALPSLAATRPRTSPMKHLIKPPRLNKGDLVGLIAPGGYTSDASIQKAVKNIEALGFRVKPGNYLREVWGNYGGTVAARIADLHGMVRDPEVKAIWAIRGGSGCISLLKHLDFELIRKHPKILLGYSDITALHLAIHRHAGVVSFHGPVASSTPSDYSNQHMLAVLMDPRASYTIPMSAENARRALQEPQYAIRTVHGGVATGPLMGGNLSLVSALAGTPYAADFRDSLLFIEEVNEEPYRIDRWMTQLDLAVGLDKAAGVMIGICENCGPQGQGSSLSLDETLDLHLQSLHVPAVSGYSFGHIRNQFTIPVGVRATLDTAAQTLTLLEPAVS